MIKNNQALWLAKKNQLCVLIKKISDTYGGDEIEWLRDYCREIVELHKNDLQKALDCFLGLEKQLRFMKK